MLHPTRLGTARLLQPDEIEGRYPYREGGYWLGRSLIRGAEDPYADGLTIGADDDRHFMLVGGTRGGKGQSVIVPNLCLWPGSVLCIDPKGENAMLTADARSEGRNGHPQNVYVLDPFKVAGIVNEGLRARFNPLWELMERDPDGEAWGEPGDEDYEPPMRPVEHAVDEAAIIASAIVVDEDSKEKSAHWNNNARRLIGALILHVITSERFRGRRNLVTVRKLLMAGDEELYNAAQDQGVAKGTPQMMLWENVAMNDAFDGVIHEDAALFADMAVTDPEQFSGVLSTAANHTEFLKSPKVRAMIKQSDFRLEELKTDSRGISIYLCLPLRFINAYHYRWLRMVIGLATQQMEKTQLTDLKEDCACGHKVLMVLDEFTSLRRMSYLEEALTQYGGAGLKMFFAVQTLDRLKTVYPDGWEAFISQCGVKYFFNADDNLSREYISKLVGETEVCIEQKGGSTTRTNTGGWSETDTDTHSSGGGSSTGEGGAHQLGTNASWNRSNGGNRNWNEGRSGNESRAYNSSWSVMEGEGQNFSTGVSRVAYRGLFDILFGGKSYEPRWTESSQSGTSRQRSVTEGGGTTETYGTGWNRSNGGGENWTDGRGGGQQESNTTNWNRGTQTNYSDAHAHAVTKNGSEANATGQSVQEQWQRRPVFLPEEVGRFFSASETKDYETALATKDALYPGLALVLKGGGVSMVVRRVNYYEDRRFVGLFNPHKRFTFRPLPPLPQPEPPAVPVIEAPLALPSPSRKRRGWGVMIVAAAAQLGFLLLVLLAWLARGVDALVRWVMEADKAALIGGTWLALTAAFFFGLMWRDLFDEHKHRAIVACIAGALVCGGIVAATPLVVVACAWAAGQGSAFLGALAAHWFLLTLCWSAAIGFDVDWVRRHGDDTWT